MANYPMKQLAAAVLTMALFSTAPSGAQTTPPPNTGPTSATTANPELTWFADQVAAVAEHRTSRWT